MDVYSMVCAWRLQFIIILSDYIVSVKISVNVIVIVTITYIVVVIIIIIEYVVICFVIFSYWKKLYIPNAFHQYFPRII